MTISEKFPEEQKPQTQFESTIYDAVREEREEAAQRFGRNKTIRF